MLHKDLGIFIFSKIIFDKDDDILLLINKINTIYERIKNSFIAMSQHFILYEQF